MPCLPESSDAACCVFLLFLLVVVLIVSAFRHNSDWEVFFRAMRRIERTRVFMTREVTHIGPYGITRNEWLESGVPGRWEDCRGDGYSRKVLMAYWMNLCPDAVKKKRFDILAGLHFGGWNGFRSSDGRRYWKAVYAEMRRIKEVIF